MTRATNTGGTGAAPGPAKPIHQAFSWVEKGVADVDGAEFAALTMDVCHGIQTCLQLIHVTDISISSGAGDEDPPILGTVDKERLLLLALPTRRMPDVSGWPGLLARRYRRWWSRGS